jgi:hypothetical protein
MEYNAGYPADMSYGKRKRLPLTDILADEN